MAATPFSPQDATPPKKSKDWAGWWKLGLPYPVYTHVPRLAVESTSEMRAFLNEWGFVIVRDVLSPAEVDGALSRVWDAIEEQGTGVRREAGV